MTIAPGGRAARAGLTVGLLVGVDSPPNLIH